MQVQNLKSNAFILKTILWTILAVFMLPVMAIGAPPSQIATTDLTVFEDGTPAYAGQVNGNFNVLRDKTNQIIQAWPSGQGESLWESYGSDIYYDSGNVGIGTSSPTYHLEVVHDADNGHSAIGWRDPTNNVTGYTSADNSSVYIGSSSNHDLNLTANGTSRITITNSGNVVIPGNVGIGTSSPTYHLEVVHDADNGHNAIGWIDPTNDVTGYTSADNGSVYIGSSTNHSLNLTTNRTNRVTITSSGDVGIGTANPSYELHVIGDIHASGTVTSSDKRFKKNIQVLGNNLEKLTQLKGVSFEWRTDEFPENGFKSGIDIGVIAQEVEKVFPEVVSTDNDGYKSVAYNKLVAPMIEAIKEQQAMIEQQKQNMVQQQQTIEQLTVLLQKTQEQMASMNQEMKNVKAVMDTITPSPQIQTAALAQ